MQLALRDKNPAVVDAWRRVMPDDSRISIELGDPVHSGADAVVSPANSYGWMDGGIDLDYRSFFGAELEQLVQTEIERLGGELPVGQALVIPTGHADIHWLIVAPTMRVPESIEGTMNVLAACRAALQCALECKGPSVETLALPGLGTGHGCMNPVVSAAQMRNAVREVLGI